MSTMQPGSRESPGRVVGSFHPEVSTYGAREEAALKEPSEMDDDFMDASTLCETDRSLPRPRTGLSVNSITGPVSPNFVHLCLFIVQVLFGGGIIIAKLTLSGFNPILFAWVRETFAAPIIFLVARRISADHRLSVRKSLRVFFFPGLLLWANQFHFIVGLKLADETSAGAWQPSQPILTAIIAFLVGLEDVSWRKVSGMVCGMLGAMLLVLGGATAATGSSRWMMVSGNLCFLINCSAQAVYVIVSRHVIIRERVHPSYCVAYAYAITSVLMGLTLAIIGNTPSAFALICPDCDPKQPLLYVPPSAIPVLIYWVVFLSVTAYVTITWATLYVEPSAVNIWTIFQPVTVVVLTVMAILIYPELSGTLSLPGSNCIGAIPVVVGLVLVVGENHTKPLHAPAQVLKSKGGNTTAEETDDDAWRMTPDVSDTQSLTKAT
eukprot:Selendium_serpulae@DN5324_c0_g1_i2.p1